MDKDIEPRILECVDGSRRDLVRKLLFGSAFVLPAVASFPMDALAQSGSSNVNNWGIGGGPLMKGPGGQPAPHVPPPPPPTLPPPNVNPGPRR